MRILISIAMQSIVRSAKTDSIKAIHNQTENILPDTAIKHHGPKCIA